MAAGKSFTKASRTCFCGTRLWRVAVALLLGYVLEAIVEPGLGAAVPVPKERLGRGSCELWLGTPGRVLCMFVCKDGCCIFLTR